ncbi:MAG: hypothetical protein OWQ57_06345 [Sulfobacillus sp.]|nr:hypothetical protein [Sulfobacillus sp.]
MPIPKWTVSMVFLALVTMTGCGSAVPRATASSTAQTKPLVEVATVTVSGKPETILVNHAGDTLYYFVSDQPDRQACTGACQALWLPLKASAAPSAVAGVTGRFSLFHGQVEYNGHLLYTYRGDFGPHELHGQGVQGLWFVATPSLPPPAGSSGSSW